MSKQQIIILCGADMTGKTHIAKELSKRISIPYFKASTEHASFLVSGDHFLNQLRFADPRTIDLLEQTKSSIIMDRGYPCEWVYSRVLNRETDQNMLDLVDREYARLGTSIVICHRSSYDGIVDDIDPVRLNSRRLQELDQTYIEFIRWTKCRTFLLNVDDENLDREVNDVLFMLGLGGYRHP